MKEKIKLIRLILSTILLSLLIISIFKSCSYAQTFEDFIDFCVLIKEQKISGTNASQRQVAEYIINNKTTIENSYSDNDYSSFVGCYASNRYLEMYTGTPELYLSGSLLRVRNQTSTKRLQLSSNSISASSTNSALNNFSCSYSDCFALTDGTYPSNLIANNKFAYINIVVTPNTNPPLPIKIADAFYGSTYTDVQYYLLDENNQIVNNSLETHTESVNNGSNVTIWVNNSTNLIKNGRYKVLMQNNNTDFILSDEFVLNWYSSNTGDITNSSGETTGNVDLSGITTGIESLNSSINQQGENITNAIIQAESGEKQRQSFWENVYNTMFIPSGDKIETKINELKEHIGISGDISGELLILNNIKNNSGDFIISWNTISSHFSINGNQLQNQLIIPSGEINFSKIERDNEAFQKTMQWVRVLLGFSLIVLVIKQWWTLILKTLGLSTEVYEQHTEEQERLKQAQAKAQEKEKKTIARQLFNANQERLREYNKLAKQKGWKNDS